MAKHIILTRWAPKRHTGLRHLEYACKGKWHGVGTGCIEPRSLHEDREYKESQYVWLFYQTTARLCGIEIDEKNDEYIVLDPMLMEVK